MVRRSIPFDPDSHPKSGGDLPLFPMSRRSDPETSRDAAKRVASSVGKLRQGVWEAFHELGEMTAKEAEELARFDKRRPSTVRKRVSELAQAGLLELTGERRDGCGVYRVAGRKI